MGDWTPEQIEADYRIASAQKWRDALAEIARLQAELQKQRRIGELREQCQWRRAERAEARVAELEQEVTYQENNSAANTEAFANACSVLQDRDRRREELLHGLLSAWDWRARAIEETSEESAAINALDSALAKIRAELGEDKP